MRTLIKLVLFLFFIRKSFRSHSLDFSAHFFSFLSLLSLAVLSRDFCIFADANGLSIPCRIYFFSLVPHDFQTVNIRFAHRSLTPPVHNLGHAGRRKMKQIAIPQRIGTLSAADDLIDFNSIRYYSHTHTHSFTCIHKIFRLFVVHSVRSFGWWQTFGWKAHSTISI